MESFFGDSTIPPVLGILLLIWFGIIIYLFLLDNKISKIEKKINKLKD